MKRVREKRINEKNEGEMHGWRESGKKGLMKRMRGKCTAEESEGKEN